MKTLETCWKLIKTTLSLITLLSLIMIAESCKDTSKQQKDEVTKEDVEKQIGEAAETTKAYLSEEREKIVTEYEAQIAKAEEQIETFKQQMASANENMKEKYQKTINSLEKQKDDTRKKIDDFKESSEDAWANIKEGVDKALSELDQALQDAKDEFES